MFHRAHLAEFLGTFVLALGVAISIAFVLPLATPLLAAMILGLFVYTLGHVSGAHFNPAVTIGLLTAKKIKSTDAMMYILAQILGALAALIICRFFITNTQLLAGENTLKMAAGEIVGTAIFTFGVMSVVTKKVHANLSGIVIGFSLLLGIIFASTMSNGILNPAVALTIGFSPVDVVGQIIGGIIGVQLYKAIC
jgi:glycerol uptake facilitator-like aquaporin